MSEKAAAEVRARVEELLREWPLAEPHIDRELTDIGDRAWVWLVETDHGPWVAKLTFDRPEYVEPGLRIASFVEAAGVLTGAPMPAKNGQWCLPVAGGDGRTWTLAVLRYIPGVPLNLRRAEAPEIAGDMLGRVHRILMSPRAPLPAGRLLEYYAAEAKRLPGSLLEGTLYGDPSPEILCTWAGSPVGLIDWGTPSRGPLLFDVVSWHMFVTAGCAPENRESAGHGFLAAYRRHIPLTDDDLAAWPLVADFYHSIHGTP